MSKKLSYIQCKIEQYICEVNLNKIKFLEKNLGKLNIISRMDSKKNHGMICERYSTEVKLQTAWSQVITGTILDALCFALWIF